MGVQRLSVARRVRLALALAAGGLIAGSGFGLLTIDRANAQVICSDRNVLTNVVAQCPSGSISGRIIYVQQCYSASTTGPGAGCATPTGGFGEAKCPIGARVTGGGYSHSSATRVTNSMPMQIASNQWAWIVAVSDLGATSHFDVYAVCAS